MLKRKTLGVICLCVGALVFSAHWAQKIRSETQECTSIIPSDYVDVTISSDPLATIEETTGPLSEATKTCDWLTDNT